jgi:hypothetical protein
MRYKIGDNEYAAVSLMKPTVKQFLMLANDSGKYGKRWTQGEVFKLQEEIGKCTTEDERNAHPEWMFLLALNMWASFAVDGVEDPFEKAISLNYDDDVQFIVEPGDEPEAADADSPTVARAVSGRAGVKRPVDHKSPRKTSKKPSTLAS